MQLCHQCTAALFILVDKRRFGGISVYLTATALVGIIILLILIFIGMNIGMAMMLVGFGGYWYVVNFNAALGVLQTIPASQAAAYGLSVIPLFVLMGNFAFAAGMSEGLYNVGHKWLGRLPGGLACATVAACAGFGAICGSTTATTATMGTVALPEMKKYRYDDTLSTGSIAVGGTLGIMIPPSTPMIVYGIIAQLSIGRLFAAGIVPGLLLSVLLIFTIMLIVKSNPKLAPKSDKFTWKEKIASLKGIVNMLILFGCVFVGMFSGIFTVNEAAACGAFLAMVIMALMGRMSVRSFMAVLKDSVKTTGMCFLMLIGAIIFGNFLAITRVPMTLASYVGGLNVSPYIILFFIVFAYAVLGCFMDALPMIMLTCPIFLPIITKIGFDPIWFGVIIILVMELGLITPPVGMNCYVISGIAKDVPLSKIFKGSIPFSLAILLCIIIVTAFPCLATWLPTLFYGA